MKRSYIDNTGLRQNDDYLDELERKGEDESDEERLSKAKELTEEEIEELKRI